MNNVSIDVYSSRCSRLQKGFRKKLYILQCWFDSRVDGKIRIRKKLLSKRNSTCNSRTKQYAIFMDKTFCHSAHAKKIAAMSVFQVIAFLEKKPSRHPPILSFFSIFTCALVASCAQIALSISILLFSLSNLYIDKKEKSPRGFTRIWEVNFLKCDTMRLSNREWS